MAHRPAPSHSTGGLLHPLGRRDARVDRGHARLAGTAGGHRRRAGRRVRPAACGRRNPADELPMLPRTGVSMKATALARVRTVRTARSGRLASRGRTMIELIIAMAIGMIILIGVGSLYLSSS